MDNTLEPAEHASVVREYRAYERKQKKRQAHAIQSQNNKDRSKYYSYVKICKTYNEQNKLIEEAYFDVNGDPPRSNRVIASWSDEMYVIVAGRNSGTQSTMHYFHKYHAVGRFRRNISGFFFFFRPYGLYRWNPRQRILSVAYLKPQFPLPVPPRARFVFLIERGEFHAQQLTLLCNLESYSYARRKHCFRYMHKFCILNFYARTAHY